MENYKDPYDISGCVYVEPTLNFETFEIENPVECSGGDCEHCGWNPEVARKRKENYGVQVRQNPCSCEETARD